MEPTDEQKKNARIMAAVRRQIKHVIYIVKENRTYDQVFGDLPRGNGDPSLAILSPFSPNHKQLAMDFVLLDNFHDSGTVSGDGWNWSTAARANDYTQKIGPGELRRSRLQLRLGRREPQRQRVASRAGGAPGAEPGVPERSQSPGGRCRCGRARQPQG